MHTPATDVIVLINAHLQLSRAEKYRSRRQQQERTPESRTNTPKEKDETEFGTRSKVSLLDQHSELKKKAEGLSVLHV